MLANQLCLRLNGGQYAEKVPEMESNVPIMFGGGSAPGALQPTP